MTELNRDAQICRELSNGLNNMCFSSKDFLEQFDREHRCLQSEMFSLALKIIEHCSKDDYRTDERNDWCKRFAKSIVSNNSECF